ncbi:MAG: geranylgeranyl reductase family protein, partial [Thermoplasmata archaeon]|nr:geranylgeranyl reductase family protein [Thermoplasmata archaeon]
VVVGAGPAGSTVAFELARHGHHVVMVEEHARVGRPVQCAGLVSQRVLDLAGSSSFVRRPVKGATVFSPALQSVTFRAAEPRAFVIDRAGLDIHLADRAARAGATVLTGWRFDGLDAPPNGSARLRLLGPSNEARSVDARLVVGADGVASAVARAFRLRRPVEILPAFESEFGESPGDPDTVEVYLGNELSPGLFGWWIPDGDGGARAGVAVNAGAITAREYCQRLERQIARRFGRPLKAPTGFLVSGIPIGTLPRTSADRVLLVGDAAAQVKPLSGGGIYTGMRCAQIAAEVAHRALGSNDLSARALAVYDASWKAELGEEFSKALYLRRLLLRLSDADLEKVVSALKGAGLTEVIVAFGDIDFPTGVARALLRQSPSLVRLFPKALSALLSSGGVRAPELDVGPRRSP